MKCNYCAAESDEHLCDRCLSRRETLSYIHGNLSKAIRFLNDCYSLPDPHSKHEVGRAIYHADEAMCSVKDMIDYMDTPDGD